MTFHTVLFTHFLADFVYQSREIATTKSSNNISLLKHVGIYASLTGESVEAVLARFGGQGFGAFKPALAEVLIETLQPISERFNALRADTAALDAILIKGAERAAALAAPTLAAAYQALGLQR